MLVFEEVVLVGCGNVKKLSVCLVAVLVLALFTAFYVPKRASSNSSPTVTVSPSQQDSWMYWGSGSGNGTVYEISVDVIINDFTDMAGWQFGLFWNNTALSCDSVVIHNFQNWTNTLNLTDNIMNNYNATNGYYWFAYAEGVGSQDFTNTTLDVATLAFHQLVNESGTTLLTFGYGEVCDGNFYDIPFSSATSGSVVMHAGTASTTVTISGNGSTIQLGPYPTNWTNWQCAQSNDGDTSYVSTGSGGTFGEADYDLYNASCPWIPSGASNVTVSIHIIARSTSASYKATFAATINATSIGYEQAGSFKPSTSYQEYSSNFTIAASDGASLQIGVYINPGTHMISGMMHYYDGYCTQVYAIITWT